MFIYLTWLRTVGLAGTGDKSECQLMSRSQSRRLILSTLKQFVPVLVLSSNIGRVSLSVSQPQATCVNRGLERTYIVSLDLSTRGTVETSSTGLL